MTFNRTTPAVVISIFSALKDRYPDFEYNGLTPSCANCPPTIDPDTGEPKFYDPKFSFFVKGGYTNKLVIYFQGGGACWHTNNCLYVHTYMEEVPNIADYDTRFMGIFDTELFLNAFKNWYFVYIPYCTYCTGDIHWGARDTGYPDPLAEIRDAHKIITFIIEPA